MSPLSLLPTLLIIAFILVDAVIVQSARGTSFPEPGPVVLLGLVLAQIAVLALWQLHRRASLTGRTLLLLVAIATASVVVAEFAPGRWFEWLALLMVYYVCTLLSLLGVRLLSNWDERAIKKQPFTRQITLSRLFAWTTATACLLGVARWLSIPWIAGPMVAAFCFPLATAATTCLWSVVHCRNPIVGLFAIIAAAAAAIAIFIALNVPKGHAHDMAMVVLTQILCTALGGTVLKIAEHAAPILTDNARQAQNGA